MAAPRGKLVTPVAFDQYGNPLALEVDDDGFLKVVIPGAPGEDLLSELVEKLEPGDLNIEAGSKDLQVDVKSSALPTGAATQTTLAALLTELGQKLEPGDLNIEGTTGNLQVDVKSSALPTNAATDDTLSSLLTELLQKLETADLNIEAVTKHLQVDVVAAPTTTVTQTTPANLLSGSHGYVNSAWQKTPLQFGYSAALAVLASSTNLPAGTSTVSSAACPAGFIWIITHISVYTVSTTIDFVTVAYSPAGTFVNIFKQLVPVSYSIYDRQGWWVLEEGDILRLSVADATLGDDVFLTAGGFLVDITL